MPLFYKTPQSSHKDNFIVEDPDPAKGRIFVENMGCNVKDLNIRFGEFFNRQGTNGVYHPYTSDDLTNGVPLYTQNKSAYYIAIWANQDNVVQVGHCDPWMASLDYENIPGVRQVKTSSGLIVMARYSGYTTAVGLGDFWIGYDCNEPATYILENTSIMPTMFYEDPGNPNEYYCFRYYSGTTYMGKVSFTPLSVTFTSQRGIGGVNCFFVGKCSDGTPMHCEVNGNNQNIAFYNYPSAGSPTLVYEYYSRNPNTYHYQYPSNVRYDTDTKRVFYQGGWDAHPIQEYKQLFMERFVFNPETKTVVSQPCTLTYPEGTDSRHYQIPVWYESTWHASTRNAWFYKPHQFSVGDRKFITMIFVDKAHHWNYTYRPFYYRGVNRCNWMTFEIDENDDTILNFHSVIKWEETRSFPRYYMPINETGTQILVIKNEEVCTITFDVDTGWYKHDFESIAARSAAIDTAGRIYLGTVGTNTTYDTNANIYNYSNGYGYCRIYQYNPSLPTNISVSLENDSYTYQGSDISTNLIVYSKDSQGEFVEKNLRISISGNNLFFSDGTQVKEVTTLTSGTLSVPVSITGGGRPNITVNVI